MGGINIPDDLPVEFYSPNLHFLRRDVSIQFNSTKMCSEADNENESWSSLISIFACYKAKKIIRYLKDGRKIIDDIIEKVIFFRNVKEDNEQRGDQDQI